MSYIYPEDVARKIIELYTDDFDTRLQAVASARDATEEVVLTDFVTRTISSDPERLDKRWQFPALVVATGPMTSIEEEGMQQYNDFYGLDVSIFYYLKYSDAREITLATWRYGEATLDFLNRHPKLDITDRGGVDTGSIEMSPSNVIAQGNALVRGLMTKFVFKILGYGF